MSFVSPPLSNSPDRSATRAGLAGWVLFDWAAQPFFSLVQAFLYAPFFANAIIGNAVTGQAIWGYATAAAGVLIALASPVLGAIADASGRRKPWIVCFSVAFAIACALLWFGKPGQPATAAVVLAAFVVASIMVEFTVVFTNAMIPTLVPANRVGWLSGLGAAVGNVGGVISIVIAICLLVGNPATGKTVLGIDSVFGLDAKQGEGIRAIGPFAALWFALFLLPLFLFTPDVAPKMPVRAAVRSGVSTLRATISELPRHRNVALFLLANMIYTDGLIALFSFGGILASGILGWTSVHVGIFGILVTIAGIAGAFAGGVLSDRAGPKFTVVTALAVLILALGCILSIGPDHIGPFVVEPPQAGGFFASAADRAYLCAGMLIGLASGGLLASTRIVLIRVAPADKITQFFGLFALTGRVTAFLGPLAVATMTYVAGSQRAGIAVLLAFFLGGMLLLLPVKTRD